MQLTIEAMSYVVWKSIFGMNPNLLDYPLDEIPHLMEKAADGDCRMFALVTDGPVSEPRLYEME